MQACRLVVALAAHSVFCAAFAQNTVRVSVSSQGEQGNGHSLIGKVSSSGRYVTFHSAASNLVIDDSNMAYDVFLHDRVSRQTTRISVASDGSQGNGASLYPAISADGRWIAFSSDADNLIAADTNGVSDIFVHDRVEATTARVSVSTSGVAGSGRSDHAAISGDGRYVAFNSIANNLAEGDFDGTERHVFLHDRQTQTTVHVGSSSGGRQNLDGQFFPSLSHDGRFVAFQSGNETLVPDDTNTVQDVFVYDRVLGSTERVSVSSAGQQGYLASYNPSLSADGRFVAFDSQAPDLVPDDTNYSVDVFVRDRHTSVTNRVSVASDGGQGIGFTGNANSPAISANARWVAFGSISPNLVAGDTNGVFDVFVHDRLRATTTRVNMAWTGGQSDGGGGEPSISADGEVILFTSFGSDLVGADTNGVGDIFIDERAHAFRIFAGGFEPQ